MGWLPPSRDWFAIPSVQLAPALLGAVISNGDVSVRLTEVEAYAGEADPGSHAAGGRTPRNSVMYGAPGHLYLYFTYGMHTCANVVCGREGEAAAVLLRAGEVVEGEPTARRRREARRRPDAPRVPRAGLARGPANLVVCLDLTLADNGHDLLGRSRGARPGRAPGPAAAVEGPSMLVTEGPAGQVRTGPRTGVAGPGGEGTAYPWRFWLEGEPSVSTYRPAVRRRRARPAGTDEAG